MRPAGRGLRTGTLILLALAGLQADPRLPAIISDHMVLQRGQAVPIWGWADPGEAITVTIGGQRHATAADRNGRWQVRLKPVGGGSPLEMQVAGNRTIAVRDILAGEVWLCSGQSNMVFELKRTTTAAREIQAAGHPEIRLFEVAKESLLEPAEDVRGEWKICSPSTARDFSAVGYLFGRDLRRELGVPVGLIQSAWSGSTAEEWTTPEKLRADASFAPILARWRNAPPEEKRLYERPVEFDLRFDGFALVRAGGEPKPVTFDDWSDNLPDGSGGHSIEVLADGVRIHGQLRVSDTLAVRANYDSSGQPGDCGAFAGISFRVRGHGWFRLHSIQPDITDWDNYASSPIQASLEGAPVIIRFADLKQAGWGVKRAFNPGALKGLMLEPVTGPKRPARLPGGLYNGMIAPLIPYAIRGVAWYQGEGNAGRAFQYRTLLPALIDGWRWEWRQERLPFLIVQLPNYKARKRDPSESAWAELREAQLMTTQSVDDVGLAVTIDAGTAEDVHPRDKGEVSRRLAWLALGAVYKKRAVSTGPFYKSRKRERGRIRLKFDRIGGGLAARGGGPLKGFAIAGSDGQFYWAEAKIDGREVVVSSIRVPDPVAVRYAWADNPDCNLYNREGLPASPFRTDDWPGVTVNSR